MARRIGEGSEYDPREHGETITMEDVSLMPDFLGFDALKSVIVVIVCIFLLTPAMLSIYLFPVMLAIDALILLSAFIIALVTPSHISSVRWIRRRRAERNGIKTVHSNPFGNRGDAK